MLPMAWPILESDKASSDAEPEEPVPRVSWVRRWRRPTGAASAIGLALLALYVLAALASFLPMLPDPRHVATDVQLAPPSSAHIMGTDQFGRDVFTRILVGIRISLEIIVPSSVLAMVVGTLLGL